MFIRHGQTYLKKENLFTGWANVDLTEAGIEEANIAGEILIIILTNLTFALLHF